jgi:hypothetical protein
MELGPEAGRRLAGVLTASRVLLNIGLARLGVILGAKSMPAAVPLIILCWLTDLVDGPLARQVRGSPVAIGQSLGRASPGLCRIGTQADRPKELGLLSS